MKVRHFLLTILLCSVYAIAHAQTDYSGMVNCFKQGDRDNAAAISLIKASIAAFEVGHVFEEQMTANGSIDVKLKNGKQFQVGYLEMQEATKAADLRIKDCNDSNALNYANKCYAIMAKIRQLQNGGDYASALKYLDGEVEVQEIYLLLGLEKNIKKFKNGAYVENRCAMVVWRGKDVVYSCNGIMDRKGKQINMSVFYNGRFQVVDEWDADMNPGRF